MKPNISSPSAVYSSHHEVFGRQEGSRSSDPCSNPQTPTPHRYSTVRRRPFVYPRDDREFLQPLEDDAVPASEYSAGDTTDSHPPSLDTYDSVPGSARVIVPTVVSRSPLPTFNPPSDRFSGARWHSRKGPWSPPSSRFSHPPKFTVPFTRGLTSSGAAAPIQK